MTQTKTDRTAPSFTSIEDFGDAHHITAPPYGILVGIGYGIETTRYPRHGGDGEAWSARQSHPRAGGEGTDLSMGDAASSRQIRVLHGGEIAKLVSPGWDGISYTVVAPPPRPSLAIEKAVPTRCQNVPLPNGPSARPRHTAPRLSRPVA